MLRRCLLVICMPAPLRNRFTLPRRRSPFQFAVHRSERALHSVSLRKRGVAWSLINGTYDRLTAVIYGDLANSSFLLAACPVVFRSAH